jgi:hypothetical protein
MARGLTIPYDRQTYINLKRQTRGTGRRKKGGKLGGAGAAFSFHEFIITLISGLTLWDLCVEWN